MHIGEFHSFTEILCITNLGFAGSRKIRNIAGNLPDRYCSHLSERLLKIGPDPDKILKDGEKVVLLNERSIVDIILQKKYDEVKDAVGSIMRKNGIFDTRIDSIPLKFRSIFLISGIYALILMVIAGFEQIDGNLLFFGFLPPLSFIVSLSVLLFLLNFCPFFNCITDNLTLAISWIFCYSVTIFLLYLIYEECWAFFWSNLLSETFVAWICLLSLALPFILFFISYVIHYSIKVGVIFFGSFRVKKKRTAYIDYSNAFRAALIVFADELRSSISDFKN
jgi:hypothetical protein